MHSLFRARNLSLVVLSGLLGACSSAPPATFDLTAPEARAARRAAQVVVSEPLTTQDLDSQRIIVKNAGGQVSFVGDAQWADRLPRLVQMRMIQTFQNARSLSAVGRPGDRLSADYQLNSDIRAFQFAPESGEAVVEIAVTLIDDKSGRAVRTRIFSARVAGSAADGAAASNALDAALSQVLAQIVRWVG